MCNHGAPFYFLTIHFCTSSERQSQQMFYRRGQLDQEARPGLCVPMSPLGKQKNNTSKQTKGSSGCGIGGSEDRKHLSSCNAQAKHGEASSVWGCVFHISASVNFPVLKNYPGLPNTELRGVVSFFLHGRRFRASTVGMQRFIVRQQQD